MTAETPSAAWATLTVISGPHEGIVQEIGLGGATIGRDSSADVQLANDSGCSRVHCCVRWAGTDLTLEDLDSSNGTWIDSTRISAPVNLVDGAMFSIGGSVIRCQVALNAVTAPPTLPVSDQQLRDLDPDDVPQIPGYQTQSLIGKGATAWVFSACRVADGQTVAIKMLRPDAFEMEHSIGVFTREASISMKLQHPAIIKTFDFGIHSGHPFLVMEYLQRAILKRVFGRSSLPGRVRVVSGMGTRLLSALDYAHRQDLVHRDVKPGNVIPYFRGKKLLVKLGDFGLAKNFKTAGETDVSRNRDIKGTVAFMSPEQIESSRFAGPQSDIYAVGACLYYWITGKYPFKFRNIPEGLDKVRREKPIPLQERLPGLPDQFARIVEQALAKAPSERFQTAQEMLLELERLTQRSRYETREDPEN